MSRAIIWLSGFAFGGAVALFRDGDPWAGFLVAASFACLALASTKDTKKGSDA